MNRKQMEKEAAEAEYARKKQTMENLNFVNYLSRAKADTKEIEEEKTDLSHLSLINEKVEDAEAKRHERKQLLNAEMKACNILNFFFFLVLFWYSEFKNFIRVTLKFGVYLILFFKNYVDWNPFRSKQNEYFKKLQEKQRAKIKEHQREVRSLEETQKLNAEYEGMMAARKAQSTIQFKQDLQRQIELKNMAEVIWTNEKFLFLYNWINILCSIFFSIAIILNMHNLNLWTRTVCGKMNFEWIFFLNILQAHKVEQEAKHRQEMEEMTRVSSTLTQKLLDEGINSILPKHPFYKCLLHKDWMHK